MTNSAPYADGPESRTDVQIAFVMDPIPSLSLKKDSTLAMIRAAKRRGWQIFFVGQDDLLLHEGQAQGYLRPLRLIGAFAESLDPGRCPGTLVRAGERSADSAGRDSTSS